ncbi:energy transducer TonB [Pseudanabaena yagii]|uniref:TonB family protein n=1 Tax=Pseudanabaena yagii GIHE-NHR1 TaxID=2722753 RepID=A0ABX1LX79_9CYAN|nr:energy transducer TonB [Pseudanabaena yagii]NMF60769.1 TonB family protein [Pseudanabaena yagii GIHE-NHR1]
MNDTQQEQELHQQLANSHRDREWKALKIFMSISIPCSVALHFVTLSALPQLGGQVGNSNRDSQEELLEFKIVEESQETKLEDINQILDTRQAENIEEAIAFAPIANLKDSSTIGNPDSNNTSTDSAKGAGNLSPTDSEKPIDSQNPAEAAKDIVKTTSSILSNTLPNALKVAPNTPNLFQGKGSLGSLVPNGTNKNATGLGWGKNGDRQSNFGNGRSSSSALGKIGAPLGLPTGNINSTSTNNSNNPSNSTVPANPSNNSPNTKIRCQSCAKPDYPVNARDRGLEGQAKVAVDVDSNGNVINVRLLNSSGHSELDEAAKQAAWNWKFDPSQNGKQAIPASINFQIENSDYAKRRQEQRQLEPKREENIAPIAAPIQPSQTSQNPIQKEPVAPKTAPVQPTNVDIPRDNILPTKPTPSTSAPIETISQPPITPQTTPSLVTEPPIAPAPVILPESPSNQEKPSPSSTKVETSK